MKNFTYHRPDTAAKAVALLDKEWGGTELLAGGTDLLDLQKEYILTPDKVVSLADVKGGFEGIAIAKREPPIFSIGGGVKIVQLAESETLRKYCPAVAQAASILGTPQIRNMATVGGNLCQRNRCWYFRDIHVPCLLKGGDKCFALDGENRYHAIFTKGHKCVMVHPSTLVPALIAVDAVVEAMGPNGKKRGILAAEFFQAPSSAEEREHVLKPDEMVMSVQIDCKPNQKSASYEVKHKRSYDWPLVQAAVGFTLEGGKASNVKIVLGHVAPTPHLAEAAAKVIEGKEVTEETAAAAGEKAADGANPLSQNEYKTRLVAVAVKRALLEAVGKKYW